MQQAGGRKKEKGKSWEEAGKHVFRRSDGKVGAIARPAGTKQRNMFILE
jgi:hypothetical protein